MQIRTLFPSLLLSLGVAASTGCLSAEAEPTDPVGEPSRADEPELTWTTPDPERCLEVEEDASDLIAAVMDCDSDQSCSPEPAHTLIEDPCLPSLACYVPVSDDIDLEPVIAELEALDREYQQACGICPIPRCANPDRVAASCEAHSCELYTTPKPTLGEPGLTE